MLSALLLARTMQCPSTSSFTTMVFCLFLSLGIWTVAVVGLHHMKVETSSHDHHHQYDQATTTTPTRDYFNPTSKQDLSVLQQPTASWYIQPSFRLELSTEENYQVMDDEEEEACSSSSSFADLREDLDYSFHKQYTCERQQFQDSLIESMLKSTTSTSTSGSHQPQFASAPEDIEEGGACSAKEIRNWIVFTAGVMGAGKSYTMKQLHEKGMFPLDAFVTVDPDTVRRHLPEFDLYVQQVPEKAGYRTRKESGMIAELLTEAALQRHQNVLVDGTLRNSTWYQEYFQNLRSRYPRLRIGILHVTAPREAVLERAMSRAKVTGRVVPRDLLERTMLEVPKSIQILSKLVDFSVELNNPPDSNTVEIATQGITWESFQNTWKQSCHNPDVDKNVDRAASSNANRRDYFASLFHQQRERPQLLTAATVAVG